MPPDHCVNAAWVFADTNRELTCDVSPEGERFLSLSVELTLLPEKYYFLIFEKR
jgi:hypothetical protein